MNTAGGGIAGALLKFCVAQALLVAMAAFVLSAFVWTSPDGERAVRASAWLAVGVQVVTFAIAVLASTCTKVRMPPGGGVTPCAAACVDSAAGVDAGATAPSGPSSPPLTR